MKKELHQFCQEYIDSRIRRIQAQIAEVKSALTSESKSTAGDKHETGRAMLQLEREKLGQRLLEVEKMQQILKKVPLESTKDNVILGSLVRTDKAMYFIGISAGKLQTEGNEVFCISTKTPIGQLLLGKTAGEVFEFNGNKATILEVR